MAWSPDEQNRLTVTADASTGTPARRLAMRATLSPCSPSGIAHPTITSSMSAGSSPPARFSASAMTVAPISSGRTVLSVPRGAFPTAVRTAETMTASCMVSSTALRVLRVRGYVPFKVPEQVLDRLADERGPAVEHVIRALDDDQLPGLRDLAVQLPHLAHRDHLVFL